ncbi:MAG: CBS domain-containing protein [bacterium]|nr:CBS domain-containing protein [bacterium]
MKAKDILSTKGPEVVTIGAEKTVYDAIDTLAKHRIGALIVLNSEGKIVGIVSERDILIENQKHYGSTAKVKDIMTSDVIIGDPEDELDYVEHVMTENRIRHLPIIGNRRLVGIISIGDVINAQLNGVRVEIKYLRDYIGNKY